MTENRLLDAVDALTKPQTFANWIGEPGEQKIVRHTEKPLLDLLDTLIGNNIGSGGAGKPARERVPVDVSALMLRERIDERVRSWILELGGKPGSQVTMTQLVRSWYVLWISGIHADEDRRAGVLEGFEREVRDILDPPKRIELTTPCPFCNQEWVEVGPRQPDGSVHPLDSEIVRTLNAVERESLDQSYAICRACERVWRGIGAMRILRIAMDDADAARLVVS